nr:MAG TPA: hypothetical protein [Caudoviricetes sp.]
MVSASASTIVSGAICGSSAPNTHTLFSATIHILIPVIDGIYLILSKDVVLFYLFYSFTHYHGYNYL